MMNHDGAGGDARTESHLLINGFLRLAVGMVQYSTPHLREVVMGLLPFIDDPDITLMTSESVTEPDFPTQANHLRKTGDREAYETGRGQLRFAPGQTIEEQEGRRR